MYRVVASNLRQLFTAAALLALLLVVADIWLQTTTAVPASRVVSPQASVEVQRILVPSGTAHHELLRRNSPGPRAGAANFSTNSLGLRGEEPEIPKPARLYRVLVLGDETGQELVQSVLEYVVDPGVTKPGVKLARQSMAFRVPAMQFREIQQPSRIMVSQAQSRQLQKACMV